MTEIPKVGPNKPPVIILLTALTQYLIANHGTGEVVPDEEGGARTDVSGFVQNPDTVPSEEEREDAAHASTTTTGTRWTAMDEAKLIAERTAGKDFSDIAKMLNRSARAFYHKMHSLNNPDNITKAKQARCNKKRQNALHRGRSVLLLDGDRLAAYVAMEESFNTHWS